MAEIEKNVEVVLDEVEKNDKEVVLAAVKNNSNELRFASKIM